MFSLNEFEVWLFDTQIARTINHIQIHHTLIPSYKQFNSHSHFDNLVEMRHFHKVNRGFSDIAQNLTIFPDGKIALCRSFEKQPAGIAKRNIGGICIENLGNFDAGKDEMTSAQADVIIHVVALLCKRFALQPTIDTVVYHHWFDLSTGKRTNGDSGITKSCPGTYFFGGNKVANAKTNFLPLVAAQLKALTNQTQIPNDDDLPDNNLLKNYGMVTANALNIRNGAGTNYPIKMVTFYGAILRIYEQSNGWVRVSAKRNEWVMEKYLQLGQKAIVAEVELLNVRTGPGTEFEIFDQLAVEQDVLVFEKLNNWCKIDLSGLWVSGKYLSFV